MNEKYLLSKQYEEEQRQELNRMSDEKFHLNEDFSNFRRKHDEKINEKDIEIQRLNSQVRTKQIKKKLYEGYQLKYKLLFLVFSFVCFSILTYYC